MVDPIPEKFLTLPEAVTRVAANVSEITTELARKDFLKARQALGLSLPEAQPKESADLDPYSQPRKEALTSWTKRELAIQELQLALRDGVLVAFVRDPATGTMFRLEPADWRGAMFREEIIRGGEIRALPSESIFRHNGRRVLIEEASFGRWQATAKNRQSASAFDACLVWLEREMRANPDRRGQSKREWRIDAKNKFNLTGRKFERAWQSAIHSTGATWGRPGAPRKSSQ